MISGSLAKEPFAITPCEGGVSAVVPTIQSLVLPGLVAGAPGTVQPSSGSESASNEVFPSPVETTMSSTNAPLCWTISSLA